MNWGALVAAVMQAAVSTPFTVPTPRLYEDQNLIVTVRPAIDLDLNYVGVSLMIRPRSHAY